MSEIFLSRIDSVPLIHENLSFELKSWLTNLSETLNSTIEQIEERIQPIATFTSLMIGQGTNFTAINEDGKITFDHDELYTNLAELPIQTCEMPSINAPFLASYAGSIEQYTFDVDDYVSNSVVLLHGYKPGTNVKFYLHFAPDGVVLADERVKWELECVVQPEFETPAIQTISTEVVIVPGIVDRQHIFAQLGEIDGSACEFGTIIMFRLKRIAASAAELVNSPFALAISCHIELESIGSDTI